MTKFISALLAGALLASCGSAPPDSLAESDTTEQSWTLADTTLFPADRSLVRPEDGVFLSDGRLIVADLRYGLIELSEDGVATPFGDFAAAGYVSGDSADSGGPNGVHLSPSGDHILTADVYTGKIYLTDIASEKTSVVVAHSALVNTAISDSTGAIWFTQSTDGFGEERLFEAVGTPMGDGALFRLGRNEDGSYASEPTLLVDGLDFANGFYLDEKAGKLYLSETLGNRVLAFNLDVEQGTVSDQSVLAEVISPDNMRMVADGSLWVASPFTNSVYAIDPKTGEQRVVFDGQTDKGREILAEWNRRDEAGETRLDLIGPELHGELPGLVTGMIVDNENEPVFISGLGDALVRLNR